MKYGARHSDKSTKDEAQLFASKVRSFIQAEGYAIPKTRTLTSFGGHVRIYSGETETKMPQRRSLKFIRQNEDGSKLYERSYTYKKAPEYTSIYRTDDWEGEAEHLREWLSGHATKLNTF